MEALMVYGFLVLVFLFGWALTAKAILDLLAAYEKAQERIRELEAMGEEANWREHKHP